ncbi:hypothetical protein Q1695_009935 [Nippostrongylus brasiliensis]|nr:hypothetical protein Q1695_009935 [Nippostrongylus brasiliensis]
MISQCVRFEANCFNKGKCKNCYKSKDQHSVESLEKAKVSRMRVFFFFNSSSLAAIEQLEPSRRRGFHLIILFLIFVHVYF